MDLRLACRIKPVAIDCANCKFATLRKYIHMHTNARHTYICQNARHKHTLKHTNAWHMHECTTYTQTHNICMNAPHTNQRRIYTWTWANIYNVYDTLDTNLMMNARHTCICTSTQMPSLKTHTHECTTHIHMAAHPPHMHTNARHTVHTYTIMYCGHPPPPGLVIRYCDHTHTHPQYRSVTPPPPPSLVIRCCVHTHTRTLNIDQ